MFGIQFQPQRKRYLKIMKKWNDIQYDVVNREEFHNRTVNTLTNPSRIEFDEFEIFTGLHRQPSALD
jgi:hypothetical protein